ncbi:Phosphorylated carbohydrates phosphatase [Ephemeroptericola cinctiostellae]|uniref:Phosphorylated carbohydrates phosphatase n=1 Tax=Ephemeroptericola cinctiostellae TaxID=2268024 RepID=A0A345DCS3_9BURK|nr:HAD family phosphatase [Ephemeroptericola cinctiostellae]AXF86161.1 Phosphorylated carbohydrates phosphatase [Ephemeroptericola cinctiostellae]
MGIKAILFDLDGTLVNSEIIHCQMWMDILAEYNVTLSEDDYKNHHAGIPTAQNAMDMIQRYDLDVGAATLTQAKVTATHAFVASKTYPLMPQVIETLGFFKDIGLTLVMVTGADRVSVDANLRAHNWHDVFAFSVSGDDVLNGKPAPDCYLLALEKLGLSAGECVAIEDSEHGLTSASRAGIACLAIPNPMSENHDFTSATAVLKHLGEAQKWVVERLG